MHDTERRICILEEQFIFQEKMIDELNEVIIAQQDEMSRLEERLHLLEQKLNMLTIQTGQIENPPPPHY